MQARADGAQGTLPCSALLLIYRLGTHAETELKCPHSWMKAMGEKEPEE